MTTSTAPLPKPRRPWTRGRIATHAFLAFMTVRVPLPMPLLWGRQKAAVRGGRPG